MGISASLFDDIGWECGFTAGWILLARAKAWFHSYGPDRSAREGGPNDVVPGRSHMRAPTGGGGRQSGSHPESVSSRSLEPAQAWQVLGLVNDSIQRADGKGAVTMGAAGVVGGALYSLVGNRAHPGVALDVAAATCLTLVIAAAIFSGLCLMPTLAVQGRTEQPFHLLRSHRPPPSKCYGKSGSQRSLRALTGEGHLLLEDLAAQLWANTQVARRKYQMNRLGLIAILLAILAFAVTGIIAVISAQASLVEPLAVPARSGLSA